MKNMVKALLIKLFARKGYLLIPYYKLAMSNIYMIERLRKIFDRYSIDCVIDVGANVGQYGRFLRQEVGYKGLIVSFEPDPNAFAELNNSVAQDNLWIAHNIALGEEDGELSFNIMKDSVLNSFLDPYDGDTDRYATLNVVKEKIDVPVRRLDGIIKMLKKNSNFNRILLKMDTQGYDLQVFSGASGCLSSIIGVQTEVSVLPIYKNMPDFNESLQTFRESGYEVSGIYPVEEDRFPQAIEFDCLYLRDKIPHQNIEEL